MSRARYLIGDVFDRLAEIPDGSVDLIVTSPPFLALRSYLPADHPDKAKEIGSEPTPAAFLDTLLALTAEWRRVLAPHGSIAVELGDTYAGSNAGGERTDGGQYGNWPTGGTKYNVDTRPAKGSTGWPLDKSLAGIPTLYAWSLAYGRNLLNPATMCEPWRVRNLLVWARPNPPVGALGDKWRPATSYVTVACVGRSRYFDLDAVRHHNPRADEDPGGYRMVSGKPSHDAGPREQNPAGAPPLDWCDERDLDWQPLMPLPTQPYAGSHYATFPTQLPKRLIECMCPQRVCRVCGEPSRRIVRQAGAYAEYRAAARGHERNDTKLEQGLSRKTGRDLTPGPTRVNAEYETLGWSDCQHDSWRAGVVLDPFGGSGTTAVAATGLGRDAILIDLDSRNADLARDRVGMFLEVSAGVV